MRPVLILGGVASALLAAGCTRRPLGSTGGNGADSRPLLILAFDRSGSTGELRKRSLVESVDLAAQAARAGSDFVLYRFASDVQEVYDGAPKDEDEFALLLKGAAHDSDPRRGTQYPKLMEELARRVKACPNSRVRIVIVGDGEDDFRGSKHWRTVLRDSAASLARNRKLESLTVWGVSPQARQEWREAFAGGGKLRLLAPDQEPGG